MATAANYRQSTATTLLAISLALGLSVIPAQSLAQTNANDSLVISNSSGPEMAPETIELDERWRVGGEESEMIFGHIFRADTDADGNIYLLDTQQSNVPVFSKSGEYLRTLSREGEGPGETTEPVDLTMMPDGTLAILQRFPGKAVKVSLDDVPAGSFELGDSKDGGFSALYTGRHRNGNLILVAQKSTNTETGQKQKTYVSRFDSNGKELARCFETVHTMENANPVLSEVAILNPAVFGSTVGPDGRIYVSNDFDRFSINVYSPDGQLEYVVERDFKARQKTRLERDRLQSVFDVWARGQLKTKIENNAMTINDIYIDDDNNMWVKHSRSGCYEEGATGFCYDVFDSIGVYKRQVTLACETNPDDDQIFRVSDNVVIVVKGSIPALYASMADGNQKLDEEDLMQEMEVVYYRIP